MKLYHGSYTIVTKPQAESGRKMVDFGQGFYLTNIQVQAENWSRVISIRKGPSAIPTISVFEFDYNDVTIAPFRVKIFSEYDKEWLEYVVDCRRGGKMQQEYDIIEGGVANDNVIDTVEDYENGRITAAQALGQLKYKKVNHQICFRNQKAIEALLTFVSSYQIPVER